MWLFTWAWNIIKAILPFLNSDAVSAKLSNAKINSPADYSVVKRGGI